MKQKKIQMSGIGFRILLLTGIAIVLATAVLQGHLFRPEPVHAEPDFQGRLDQAKAKYPVITDGSTLDSCKLCHNNAAAPPTNGFNPYGTAFQADGFDAIELLDSDNDGFDNITEINALTFPASPARMMPRRMPMV